MAQPASARGPHSKTGAYPERGRGKRAMAPLRRSGLILSSLRFCDRGANSVDFRKALPLEKNVPPPGDFLLYAHAPRKHSVRISMPSDMRGLSAKRGCSENVASQA